MFALLHDVQIAIERSDRTICAGLVGQFLVAAKEHFNREEELLERLRYPDVESHRAYHRSLMTRATELREVCGAQADAQAAEKCYTETVAFLLDDVVRGDHEFKSHVQQGTRP